MRKTIPLVAGLLLVCIATALGQKPTDFVSSDFILTGSYGGLTYSHVFYKFEEVSHEGDSILFTAIMAYENNADSLSLALVEQGLAKAQNPAGHYLLRGAIHYRYDHIAMAFADFNKAISLSPKQAEAYHNMALLYFKDKRLGNAFQFVNTALQLGNEHPETVYLLGVLQMANKEYKSAMEIWELCLQLDLPVSKVYTQIALLYYQQEEYDKAMEAASNAMAYQDGQFVPYLLAGTIHQQKKDKGKTIALWQKASEVLEGKEKRYISWMQAHVLFEEKMYIKGVDYYIQAFDIEAIYEKMETQSIGSNYLPPAFNIVLHAYSQTKEQFDFKTRALICEALAGYESRSTKYIPLLQKCVKRYPDNKFLRLAIAAWEPRFEFRWTLKKYHEAIEIAPDYWPLKVNVVSFYFYESIFDNDLETLKPYFEEYLNQIIDRFPRRHRYLSFRAQHHLEEGRIEEAIEDYTSYIELSGDNSRLVMESRGEIYLSLGEYEKAVSDFNAVYTSSLDFRTGKQFRNYAMLLYHTGDTARAWEMLMGQLERYPGEAVLFELKGDWHYDAGEYQLSMDAYKYSMIGEFYRPAYIVQSKLAVVYMKLGMNDKALQIASDLENEIRGKKYDDPAMIQQRDICLGKAYYVQSVVYEVMGEKEDALKYAQKAGDLGYVHEERIMPAFE